MGCIWFLWEFSTRGASSMSSRRCQKHSRHREGLRQQQFRPRYNRASGGSMRAVGMASVLLWGCSGVKTADTAAGADSVLAAFAECDVAPLGLDIGGPFVAAVPPSDGKMNWRDEITTIYRHIFKITDTLSPQVNEGPCTRRRCRTNAGRSTFVVSHYTLPQLALPPVRLCFLSIRIHCVYSH